jgi:hypothetical protein
MDKLRLIGDFLKHNKDIIQPASSLVLCVLVTIALFIPGKHTVVTVVQASPQPGQTNETSQVSKSGSGAVESATTTLPADTTHTSTVQTQFTRNSTSSPVSSSQRASSSAGNTTSTVRNSPVTSTQPAEQKAKTCEEVVGTGGALAVSYDEGILYSGNAFTVTIGTPDGTPLGRIFISPAGNFLASPTMLDAPSPTSSFIVKYQYPTSTNTTSDDFVTITARCGPATWVGKISVQ